MSVQDNKDFPRGVWFFCPRMPRTTTPEEFSAWFRERGVHIPADHISIKPYNAHASAIICLSRETALSLLVWALDGDTGLGNFAIEPEMMRAKS